VAGWPTDEKLTGAMDLVRAACSAALGLRKARALRVRLPLASLTIAHPDAASLAPFTELIAEEVNVKSVRLSGDPATLGTFELAVNPRQLGPRLGGKVQEVIRAVKAGAWTQSGDVVTAAGVDLQSGEYELKLAAADPGSTSALPGQAGLIALDTEVTPELAAEGTAPAWTSPTGSGSPSALIARWPRRSRRTPASSPRKPWRWRWTSGRSTRWAHPPTRSATPRSRWRWNVPDQHFSERACGLRRVRFLPARRGAARLGAARTGRGPGGKIVRQFGSWQRPELTNDLGQVLPGDYVRLAG
jgi:hypothetical protein